MASSDFIFIVLLITLLSVGIREIGKREIDGQRERERDALVKHSFWCSTM